MKAKKETRGRPKLPVSEIRSVIRQVRFSKEENELFEKAAESKGLTLSELIRQALNKAARP